MYKSCCCSGTKRVPKARARSIIVKKISMRENPVLVTVRSYDRTSDIPSMCASVTSITCSYHGLKSARRQYSSWYSSQFTGQSCKTTAHVQDVMKTRANFVSNMMMWDSAVVFFSFGTTPQIFPSYAFANYNLTSGRFISKFFRADISRNKLKLGYILRDRRKKYWGV